MNEWIKYDGANPPTDYDKAIVVEFEQFTEYWDPDWVDPKWDTAFGGLKRYIYLPAPPPEPEMPETLMVTVSKRGYEIMLSDRPGVTHYRRERTVTVTVDTYTDVCECGRRWDKCLKPDYCPGCGGKIER